MSATINSFISALNSPESLLKSLSDAKIVSDKGAGMTLSRTTNFADMFIERGTKRYLLSLPLNGEALKRGQRSSVKIRRQHSEIILDYQVLTSEMSYITSQGAMRTTDLLLQELPEGRIVSTCITELDADRLAEAILNLERELKRINLQHLKLTAENLIIDNNYTLYPIRLYYASINEQEQTNFRELKEQVGNSLNCKFEATETPNAAKEEPQHAQYGYKHVGNPFEGLCVAESQAGYYGYITPEGAEAITPRFRWAGDICEGRAEVETEQGMGLIDASGNYIIEPRYQILEYDYNSGESRAKLNGEWFIFDYNGEAIDPATKEEKPLQESCMA